MSRQALRSDLGRRGRGASPESGPRSPSRGRPARRGRGRGFDARLERWIALSAYLFTTVMLFGLPILPHPGRAYLGYGTDPGTFIWFFRWWPYAIGHGLNPFSTHLLWAPSGFNLAGATSIPGPGLVAAPITLLAGPVVSFNLVALVAPALSAWTAYLLCRHVTRAFLPSLVGGYLFGFSTYELAKLEGHLNLALTFLVPLAVLLVLRRLEGDLSPRRFVLLLGLVLFLEFLISPEVILTSVIFGGATLLLALAFMPGDTRRRILRTVPLLLLSGLLAAAALLPYLYFFFVGSSTASPVYSFYPSTYSIDPVNLFVPTSVTWIGRHDFAALATTFSGNTSEQTLYLGLPVLAMIFLFAVHQWRTPIAKVLLAALVLVVVASFGPVLHVAGIASVALPWRFLLKLPLVKYALPSRFPLYAWLLVSVMSAMWLASASSTVWTKAGLVVLAVVFLVPNLASPYWKTNLDTPAFFTDGAYRQVLRPGENVLIIPYGGNGNSMLWQAQTGMAFRMPEGYLTVTPPKAFASWPILASFYGGGVIPNAQRELVRFLRAKEVGAIVVGTAAPGAWAELFATLGAKPQPRDGVIVYQVPRSILAGRSGP